jgi:hypothetical protein
MDEKPDQIMNHIESQRDQLGRNLNELEERVRRTTDWRAQVDRNPMLAMGVALGGGLLIGSMVGGSRRSHRSTWSSSAGKIYSPANLASSSSASSGFGGAGTSSAAASPYREQRRKTSDTLENIKAALIAFGTAKVKEFMSEALPGFHQHLDEAERRGPSRHSESYSSGSQFSSSPSYSGPGQHSSEYQSGQGSGGSQYPGGTRTEQSSRSPYSQQPTGPNSGLNI